DQVAAGTNDACQLVEGLRQLQRIEVLDDVHHEDDIEEAIFEVERLHVHLLDVHAVGERWRGVCECGASDRYRSGGVVDAPCLGTSERGLEDELAATAADVEDALACEVTGEG